MSEKLTNDEKLLLSMHRAIEKFNIPVLISKKDIGAAVQALEEVVDLEEVRKELKEEKFNTYLLGFVTGLGATRVEEVLQAAIAREQAIVDDGEYEEYDDEGEYEEYDPDETEFVGGPSGGVAVGQGEDPKYVNQTGPKAETSD